jgi:hypothetical protein
MLRTKGLLSAEPLTTPFGNLNAPVEIIDRDYIRHNSRAVGALSDPLDDMFAALHSFNFRVAVSGGVAPASNGAWLVTISEVGVYVQDSYDFEGFQPLGTWDTKTNSVSKTPLGAGTSVGNDDFREWRTSTGMGGDFVVFSDVLVTRLHQPDELYI